MSRPPRINVRLPECISYGFESALDTYVQSTPLRNGHLVLNAGWDRLQHRYAGRYIKRPEDYMTLKRCFAVCRGAVSAFRIYDHFDHTMTDEEIGVGTGAELELQLIRTFDFGGYGYTDVIEAPVVGTVVVKAGASLGAAVTIPATVGELTGKVTCTPANGDKVFASCEFDRWVRWPVGFKLAASWENFKRQGIPIEWEEDFGP